MFDHLENVETKYNELTQALASPEIVSDSARYQKTAKAHSEISEIVEKYREYKDLKRGIAESKTMVAEESDGEMRAMAQEELTSLEARLKAVEEDLKVLLIPKDPNDDKNVILEIRAGTGGDEASLFVSEMFRLYTRFAEQQRWKVEILSSSESGVGGLKEVIALIEGKGAYSKLKYESGVHRVQRVPATEAQGRIHTSTATVAVLPEAEEVDLELKPEELRIEVCRAGGPGGQGVNTTDSAVQVLHIPTGTIVRCQDGRSQQKNKEKALNILRSRLLQAKQREEAEKYSAQRKSQIGSGGREEKIRTYNFPQNRVTDHRIGLTLYNLDRFIEGDLEEMIAALQATDLAERLNERALAN
jgi:peptide chain release factor 1